ncbi:hypothetical protein ABPG73_021068 [Tetrahymena malaccensis]
MKKGINQQLQRKLKSHFYYNFYQNNKTSIIVISITLFPSVLLMITTYLILNYFQSICFQLVDNFSNNLLQDQIYSSKILNSAIVFQLSSQTQKFVWYINILNEFFGKIIQDSVLKNKNHIPSILNIDKTYTNQENAAILMLLKNNSIFTSSWHQVNKSQIIELDQFQQQQLDYSIRIDSVWKAIQLVNKQVEKRQMAFKDLFFTFSYDGLIYTQGVNTTFNTYKPPQNCPYQGQFHLDARCRYYYNQTISSISTIVYNPQVFYSNANPLIVQSFCQRRLKYESLDPNSKSSNYSITCLNQDLTLIPTYFNNFGSNSKLQILLNPQYQTVIYDSAYNLSRTEIVTIQQIETNYLEDQSQAAYFIKMISQNNQLILNSTYRLQLVGFNYQNYQQMFEYKRNETECLVLLNQITIIDKLPKFETLQTLDPQPKYQIKNAFLFLNILSKEKMQQYSSILQSQIEHFNFLFKLTSLIFMLALLLVQIIYSFLLGRQTLKPIIHLTSILKELIDQNGDGLNQNFFQSYQTFIADDIQENVHKIQGRNDLAENEHLKKNQSQQCFSSDTQELFDSFKSLFKVLLFTTQNLYKENESVSLINLSIQVHHFNKFNNLRALGVCYNNIGVIHYNCSRYLESIENFQRSIVLAKYELGFYYNLSYEDQQQSFDHLANQINQDQLNQDDQEDSENWYEDCSKLQKQNGKTVNGKKLLFWSLYNRTINLIKALFSHISENNQIDLVDMLEDIILEIEKISQKHLPTCQKRVMIECYMKCLVYKLQKNKKAYFEIQEKFKNLYISNRQTKKYNCLFSSNQNIFTEEEIKFYYQNSTYTLLAQPMSTNKQIKKNNLFERYQFSSDILFQYYALEQVNFQIMLQNYYNAGLIITNLLEKCFYYVPFLKIKAFKIAASLFQLSKVQNPYLEEILTKYTKLAYANFKVCTVSACQSKYAQFRSYALQSDLINDILFKDRDQFCLINYSFEEKLYFQQIQWTDIQIIQSNYKIFQKIQFNWQKAQQNVSSQSVLDLDKSSAKEKKNEILVSNLLSSRVKSQTLNTQNEEYFKPLFQQNKFFKTNSNALQIEDSFDKECIKLNQQSKTNKFKQKNLEYSNPQLDAVAHQTQNFDFRQISLQQSCNISQSKQDYSPNNFIKDYILTPKISSFSKSPVESSHQLIQIEKKDDFKLNSIIKESLYGKYQDNKQSQDVIKLKNGQVLNNQCSCPSQKAKIPQQNMLNFSASIKDVQNNFKNKKENNSKIQYDQISCFSDFLDKETIKSQNDECKQNNFFQNILISKSKKNKISFQENVEFNQEQQQQQTEISQIDLLEEQKQNQPDNRYQDHVTSEISSEWIFHQGVQAALKQFILNTDQKIQIYLSQKNFQYKNDAQRLQQINKIKQYHTYLLFVTDVKLEITNQFLFQDLSKLLANLNIELLVLFLNQNQATEEFSSLNNVFIDQKSVVTFFNSEEKLLQYIYSQREHVKNYLLPMIFEHF